MDIILLAFHVTFKILHGALLFAHSAASSALRMPSWLCFAAIGEGMEAFSMPDRRIPEVHLFQQGGVNCDGWPRMHHFATLLMSGLCMGFANAQDKKRKPDWMKRPPVPGGEKYLAIKEKLRELKLHTVCARVLRRDMPAHRLVLTIKRCTHARSCAPFPRKARVHKNADRNTPGALGAGLRRAYAFELTVPMRSVRVR